jgi:hypothetical protein
MIISIRVPSISSLFVDGMVQDHELRLDIRQLIGMIGKAVCSRKLSFYDELEIFAVRSILQREGP